MAAPPSSKFVPATSAQAALGSSQSKTVKVTVNLPEETVEALRWLATQRGTTMTEVIRQAIANERFFYEQRAAGAKILLENEGEPIQRVVFR